MSTKLTRQQETEWFVVHTYSGYENKVRANLEKRVDNMNMKDKIFQVVVPEEEEVEYKKARRSSSVRCSPATSW